MGTYETARSAGQEWSQRDEWAWTVQRAERWMPRSGDGRVSGARMARLEPLGAQADRGDDRWIRARPGRIGTDGEPAQTERRHRQGRILRPERSYGRRRRWSTTEWLGLENQSETHDSLLPSPSPHRTARLRPSRRPILRGGAVPLPEHGRSQSRIQQERGRAKTCCWSMVVVGEQETLRSEHGRPTPFLAVCGSTRFARCFAMVEGASGSPEVCDLKLGGDVGSGHSLRSDPDSTLCIRDSWCPYYNDRHRPFTRIARPHHDRWDLGIAVRLVDAH